MSTILHDGMLPHVLITDYVDKHSTELYVN